MKKSRLTAVLVATILILITATIVSAFTYHVQWGDTLWDLSRYYGTTVDAIVQANDQITNPNLIYAGDYIEIPDGGTPASPTPVPPTVTVQPPPTVTVPPGMITYVVQRGDTLSSIAYRFNTTVYAIMQVNPQITNPNLIYAGQVILIPSGAGGYPTPTPPTNPSPTVPAPTETPGTLVPTVPPPSSGFELGGQTLVLAYPDNMNRSGMNWAKFQYKWTAGDSPDELASVVEAGHNQGFKVLISVAGEQAYPGPGGIDFASFTEFMHGLAALGPDAVEVWNEQNIDFEWPAGEISPVSYTNNMLAPAYQAVKSVNPNIMVISGALAPTGFDNGYNAWADNRYLAGMYQAGAANYMDCIGAHHNAGATSPRQSVGHPAGDHYSWYFLPTLNLYHNTFAGQKSVCFTELGYLSGEGFPGVPDNFWWAANTSVAQHAQWLAEAAELSRSSGKVRLMTVFNVDYTEYDMGGDPQAGYAMLRPDGSCPACDTLGAVMGGG